MHKISCLFILISFFSQNISAQDPDNYNYSDLTIEQKIAQLMMVAVHPTRDSAHYADVVRQIEKRGVGGLIFFKGTPEQYVQLGNRFRKASKLPLWFAIDGEWGLAMRVSNTWRYPFQTSLGAVQNNQLIEQMGFDIAQQMKRIGFHINFAPVADINNNPKNPVINYRSFGEDKQQVTTKAIAYARGLKRGGVIAVAKHFPGHGDTEFDSHLTLPVINHTTERLDSIELFPFRQLISDSVDAIMTAHLHIPALDTTANISATLSKKIVTDLLKNKLNYSGLIFTDALNMEGVAHFFRPGEIEYKALMAGCDVLLFPQDVDAAIDFLAEKTKTDVALKKRIEESFRKVIAKKQQLNVDLEPISEENLLNDLNSDRFEANHFMLFAKSITLLQNKNNILPIRLNKATKIASFVVGADSLTSFQKRLSDYTEMDHFWAKRDDSSSVFERMKQHFQNHNLVIIGVVNTDQRPSKKFGITPQLTDFLNFAALSKKAVVVYFGNAYALDLLENIHQSEALLITYQETKPMQDLAAQAIFGGIEINGKLPVHVNQNFQLGQGINTPKCRLSYTPAAIVGWNSKRIEQKIDSIVTDAIDKQAFPGCQVLAAKDGQVVFRKSYGFQTYQNNKAVNNENIYDLASVTKVLGTLPAIMKLYDEGKLQVSDPLSKYWKRLKFSNKRKTTFEQALTHQAGLTAWIPFWKSTKKGNGTFKPRTLSADSSAKYPFRAAENLYVHKKYKRKLYKSILKSPMTENPEYKYSDLSFYLYPRIIENITKQAFTEYLDANFYAKLGAKTLGYQPRKRFDLQRIVPTERDSFFRMQLLHADVHDEGCALMGGVSGHAGLFASANDVAKIMQMYLNNGVYGREQFLKKQTLDEFTRCHFCETGNRRGLGFDKPLLERKYRGTPSEKASESSYGHSGYTGTFVWNDPETGLLFVFLSNRVYPTREYKNLMRLNVRPQIHQVFYDEIERVSSNK